MKTTEKFCYFPAPAELIKSENIPKLNSLCQKAPYASFWVMEFMLLRCMVRFLLVCFMLQLQWKHPAMVVHWGSEF